MLTHHCVFICEYTPPPQQHILPCSYSLTTAALQWGASETETLCGTLACLQNHWTHTTTFTAFKWKIWNVKSLFENLVPPCSCDGACGVLLLIVSIWREDEASSRGQGDDDWMSAISKNGMSTTTCSRGSNWTSVTLTTGVRICPRVLNVFMFTEERKRPQIFQHLLCKMLK